MCKKLIFLISFALILGMAASLSAELVAYWPFNEGSGGTVFDLSGNGNDGAINGATWDEGKYGPGLHFNGQDNYVEVPASSSLDTDTNVTVAAWINWIDAGDGWLAILANGQQGGPWENYGLFVNRGGSYLYFTLSLDGGHITQSTPNNAVGPGEWLHAAATWDGSNARVYVNGELVLEQAQTGTLVPPGLPLRIGHRDGSSHYFNGAIDEVRVYNHALTEVEILAAMEGGVGYPYALAPNPEDGALYEDTWVNLSWSPGSFAASHDVYLGDNFDDVSGATADSPAFRGNQGDTFLVAGFPGFPYPEGLVPGTTYYWRIDEVNDSEPNSPWKGDVWSFSVPPKTAYGPVPAEGSKFVDIEPTLSWTGGFGAKIHTVYFGDNFDEVSNAAGGLPQGVATFTPAGPLEPEKTYYWRVDEFDAFATHKGDVWSFTTAGEGGGVKGEYFKGMNFDSLVLTRTDPQIDFSWGGGEPDPLVGADNFSCRWTGQVEAAFTETYTFYTNSDDGVRLWVDGKQLVNNWTDHGNTENEGTIDLVAGQTYSVVMELYENTGSAVGQLRWESPRTPKQLIPAAALSYLVSANTPGPPSGTVGVKLVSALTWRPGEFAASHEVYFGTDADAVANATKASPEYKGSKALGDEMLDPGKLAWDTTYYWRVDEVNAANPDSPWIGNVWSFNTGAFLVVDDFESYDDIDPLPGEPGLSRIFDKWIDGFGTTTNGALVGNDMPPYAETSIVHGGVQSMIYRYDNAGKTSEATLTLVWPRDWSAEGVTKLSLWMRGSSGNAADRVYVALNGTAVVYHDDASATQLSGWNEWVIDLSAFGVDLTNVNTITIGIGTKNAPAPDGGMGTVYFDDIVLLR